MDFFSHPFIFYGLLEFYGQSNILIGLKKVGILDGNQLPISMVAFVITSVSDLLLNYKANFKFIIGTLQSLPIPDYREPSVFQRSYGIYMLPAHPFPSSPGSNIKRKWQWL